MTIEGTAENEMAYLSIKDNGSGIIRENKGKLFKSLLAAQLRSIDLGLTTHMILVEVNGGSIETKSEKGVH